MFGLRKLFNEAVEQETQRKYHEVTSKSALTKKIVSDFESLRLSGFSFNTLSDHYKFFKLFDNLAVNESVFIRDFDNMCDYKVTKTHNGIIAKQEDRPNENF